MEVDNRRELLKDEIDKAWKEHVQGISDISYAENIINMTYNEFIEKEMKDIEVENKGFDNSEGDEERLSLTDEEFNRLKITWINLKREFEDNYIENISGQMKRKLDVLEGRTPYSPPYKKIFNGVWSKKIDPDKLSEQDKITLKIHGMNKELYDIYWDEEYKRATAVFYDIGTNNEHVYSFVEYLEKLKEKQHPRMNHKVPLILFDPMLMGINPFSDSLTHEMRQRIIAEAKINPLFFLRECVRIAVDSDKMVMWQPNIASWSVVWLYTQNFNLYHEAPRQTGKTFIIQLLMAYEYAIGSDLANMLILHYKSEEGIKNQNEIIELCNLFPEYMRNHAIVYTKKGDLKYTGKVIPTKGGISNNIINKNEMKVRAVGSTEMSATQAGRGGTYPFVFVDEFAFIKNIQAVLASVLFSHSTARAKFELRNKRTCMMFASTPGMLSTKEGRILYDLIYNGYCKFTPKLFALTYEELYTYMKTNASKDFFCIKYTYREMGLTEEWAEAAQRRSANYTDFETEVLQRWKNNSANGIFTEKELSRLADRSSKFIEETYMFGKEKITYHPIRENATFIETLSNYNTIGIGIDIANGVGGDSSVLYAIDLETASPLFMYRSNTIHVPDFALFITKLFKSIHEEIPDTRILLNIERDGPGLTLMPMLKSDPIIEPMLYATKRFIDPKIDNVFIKAYTKPGNTHDTIFEYGTYMRKVRNELFNNILFMLVERYPMAFDFRDAYDEVRSLIRTKGKGKIEAAPGFHDDIVVALLHAYSLIFRDEYRESLNKYFNFTVDFRKIVDMPITSHISTYTESTFYSNFSDVEGTVSFEVKVYVDKNDGKPYDYIEVFIVINGQRVKMSDEDSRKESLKNRELFEAMKTLRRPSVKIESHMMPQANTVIPLSRVKNYDSSTPGRTSLLDAPRTSLYSYVDPSKRMF